MDGQPKPSQASYWLLGFTVGTIQPSPGDVVTGAISGATGIYLADAVSSGAWGVDAVGDLILTEVSGIFDPGENLEVAATPLAVSDGGQREKGESDNDLHFSYLGLAVERRRALIGQVPGEGPVRGVWIFNGDNYAVRDNVGQTAGVMHVMSPSGWQTVDLGAALDFTNGNTEFAFGETVTGVTSGATGVVAGYYVTSGSWGGGAQGFLYLSNVTGTFQAETITGSTGSAQAAGAQTLNTLPPGGRYEFENYNFYGSLGLAAMYGCNGVGKAFKYDVNGFAPITTGMVDDTPSHIAAHKRHLFLSFDSSVQHSAIGDPMDWTVVSGAGELATGDAVVGLEPIKGDVLLIMNRNRTYLLYGTSSADWDLKTFSRERGAIEWSIQSIGSPFFMDDRGISELSSSNKFGDFNAGSISQLIEPLIKNYTTNVVSSVVSKEKDQYRLFMDDGSGIICHISPKGLAFTRFSYGTKVATCTANGEDSTGKEVILMGCSDGYVLQIDSGDSIDGDSLVAILRLPFNHLKSPRNKKRFYKAVAEIKAQSPVDLYYSAEYSYGSDEYQGSDFAATEISGGGAYWDVDMVWGQFIWGAPLINALEAYLDGHGLNISLGIRSETKYELPHTIQGITMHYSLRGLDK